MDAIRKSAFWLGSRWNGSTTKGRVGIGLLLMLLSPFILLWALVAVPYELLGLSSRGRGLPNNARWALAVVALIRLAPHGGSAGAATVCALGSLSNR